VDALGGGSSVELVPNPAAIIPYMGLFTLVTLDPTTTARHIMTTPHLPGLSIIRNNKFEEAPANTPATANNVARIFDSLDIEEDAPIDLAIVPLAPGVAGFEKRYWRFPVFAGAIFAALMARLPNDSSECADIVLARRIVAYLTLNSSGGSGPSGSGGPSGGRGGGRGDRSQYGKSDRLEIASSTRALGDDTPAIETNKDSSDSETGRSEHS
jgi:hypothetical protein